MLCAVTWSSNRPARNFTSAPTLHMLSYSFNQVLWHVDEDPICCGVMPYTIATQRKFSTIIKSSAEASTRVKRIVLPSGVAVNPAETGPRLRATVVDLPVAKLRY